MKKIGLFFVFYYIRPFQMRTWSCITSYPLRSLPYLAYDNVNHAMVNSMMLHSSMHDLKRSIFHVYQVINSLSPVCSYAIRKIPMDGCHITIDLQPHVIRHPSIGIFPYCVNKQGQGITNIHCGVHIIIR